jgi:hypothetical protein
MKKLMGKVLCGAAFWLTTSLLQAQSSNNVWFVSWNGQPIPSSDISVQSIRSDGSASPLPAGTAVNFISQTNFSSLNSPYDVAVDPVLGKVYVLDNNVQGATPEYIYSFNLTGTPAQIAASAQVIYTLPVPSADVTAGVYPLVSGLALDPVNHALYFNQIDVTTATNSYIGRLSLTNGSAGPQALYVGQVPGQGAMAVDASNIYLSAVNGLNGNNGIYAAPVSGSGAFSEIVTLSAGDTTFANGLVSGVASDLPDHLVYYLTYNAGFVNHQYNLGQNAVWVYNTLTHTNGKIASGYPGLPDNVAVDAANGRYYFTLGRDGTGNASPTNYQAIYTGSLGSTTAPTLFYTPLLSGQDANGQANAGNVSLQGIYIQDLLPTNPPPVAGAILVGAQKNLSLTLLVTNILAYDSDPGGYALNITAVGGASTNGGSVTLTNGIITYTPVANFIGVDQLSYTLKDNQGSQTQGKVTVNVLSLNTPALNQLTMTVVSQDRFLLFQGNASQNYEFLYANTLTGPWYPFSALITANAAGLVEYNDLSTGSSAARFYRVAQ